MTIEEYQYSDLTVYYAFYRDFYNVNVRDIRVGNVSIDAPMNSFIHGHFIVDSGTTDSYLPTSMKKPFEAAFEKVTGLKYQASGGGCKGYTNEQLDALPNIQVVLEAENGTDLVLQVTPDQYLIQEQNKYCANIFLTEFSGGGTSSLRGLAFVYLVRYK